MTKLWNAALALKVWKDSQGQELVEYALGAGLVVAASVAVCPALASSIGTVFSKLAGELQNAGGGGGGTASPAV